MSQDIKVLVVDDHDYVRFGLTTYLEACDGVRVIGTAINGKEAVERCEKLHPDVVLMDISMPVMDGITATEIISKQYPDIQVVILTNGFDVPQVEVARAAGAGRYLYKSTAINDIAEAIYAVYADSHRA